MIGSTSWLPHNVVDDIIGLTGEKEINLMVKEEEKGILAALILFWNNLLFREPMGIW